MQLQANIVKLKIQKRIVVISIILFIAKAVVYFITHSVGILTDALESIVNIAATLMGLYSLSVSLKPKDEDHPFGHGKIELVTASFEGLLIIIAGVFILYESVHRFFNPVEITNLGIGIWVIFIAGVVNYIMGYYSIKVGREHNSIALISSGKHLQSDTYSTIGLIIGLLIVYITKIVWIDAVVACIFGIIIIYTGYAILKHTLTNLIDTADFPRIKKIAGVLSEHRRVSWIDVYKLKILKFGSLHHVYATLCLPKFYSMEEAYNERKKIENVLLEYYDVQFEIHIQTEPCNSSLCNSCMVEDCSFREYPFIAKPLWTKETITKPSISRHDFN